MKLNITTDEAGQLVRALYEAGNALRDVGRPMAAAPAVVAAMLLQDAITVAEREAAAAEPPKKKAGKRGPDTKPRAKRGTGQTSIPGADVPGPGQAVDGQGRIIEAEGGAK